MKKVLHRTMSDQNSSESSSERNMRSSSNSSSPERLASSSGSSSPERLIDDERPPIELWPGMVDAPVARAAGAAERPVAQVVLDPRYHFDPNAPLGRADDVGAGAPSEGVGAMNSGDVIVRRNEAPRQQIQVGNRPQQDRPKNRENENEIMLLEVKGAERELVSVY